MTAHDDFFRKQKPAAVLKHSLLAEYCTVFTSMVGARYKGPVWFIDGYAGPGTYSASDGDEKQAGSPLVAMRIARKWHAKGSRDLRCAFIEPDRANLRDLRATLKEFERLELEFAIYEGTVQDKLAAAWSNVQGAPVLTFLDPFGVAMNRDLLLDPLLLRPHGASPSEVIVNINVEAVWRIGGNLEKRAGKVVPTVGQEKTIARVDDFLGGEWWRQQFLEAREDEGSAAAAASRVIDTYRKQIESETGCSSVSVPIRRRPGNPALFLMTLFYRNPIAAYMFTDAAARASEKWRKTYRTRELADWNGREEGLFGAELMQGVLAEQAKSQEEDLHNAWVKIVKENMTRLVETGRPISLKFHVLEILGSTVSLAGEKQIRAAWDQLATEGKLTPRDKSAKRMSSLYLTAMPS